MSLIDSKLNKQYSHIINDTEYEMLISKGYELIRKIDLIKNKPAHSNGMPHQYIRYNVCGPNYTEEYVDIDESLLIKPENNKLLIQLRNQLFNKPQENIPLDVWSVLIDNMDPITQINCMSSCHFLYDHLSDKRDTLINTCSSYIKEYYDRKEIDALYQRLCDETIDHKFLNIDDLHNVQIGSFYGQDKINYMDYKGRCFSSWGKVYYHSYLKDRTTEELKEYLQDIFSDRDKIVTLCNDFKEMTKSDRDKINQLIFYRGYCDYSIEGIENILKWSNIKYYQKMKTHKNQMNKRLF